MGRGRRDHACRHPEMAKRNKLFSND